MTQQKKSMPLNNALVVIWISGMVIMTYGIYVLVPDFLEAAKNRECCPCGVFPSGRLNITNFSFKIMNISEQAGSPDCDNEHNVSYLY